MPALVGAAVVVGKTIAAGGILGFVARTGAALVLSAGARKLMPKPSTSGSAQLEVGPRTITVTEPVRPREVVYGFTRKGGTLVFAHLSTVAAGDAAASLGGSGQFLHLVIVLAAHRVKSIGAIYFDGEVAVDANGVAQGRWAGLVDVEKRLGLPGQTAFDKLRAAVPNLWTADHRLSGCAALYIRLTANADAFPNGRPVISADVEGKDDVLDPRTGTRGYTANASLCLADYIADAVWGIRATIGAENGTEEDALIEAANVCDEAVTLAAGGTEPRYTCNGVLSLGQPPKTNIESMLTAFAGKAVYSAGVWRILAGAYRMPTLTLTDDDVRSNGLSLLTRVSRSENFNGVRGQFVSPQNDWQPDDFPAYQSAVYVAEDQGDEDWLDLNLPFTTSASMAQRIARIELERQRRQQSLRLAGKVKAWAATAGENVMVSYDRWGFSAKPFEVRGISLSLQDNGVSATLVPDLTLRETSPLVYSWDATEEQIYAAAPRTTLPSPFNVPPPGVPVVSEELYVTRNGAGVKALALLEWTASLSGFLSRYEVQGSLAGGPFFALGSTTQTRFEVLDVDPGAWVFRVRTVSSLGVRSAWVSRAATIVGLAVPPVAVTGLTLQSAGGLAILKWTLHPDLDVRIGGQIVIRHARNGTGWSNSVSMEVLPGATALAALPLLPGTYYVAARDSSGILGPVVSVAASGAQALAFSPVDLLQADPTFPGTKDGVAVSDLGLTLVGELLFSEIPDFGVEPSIGYAGGVVSSGTYTFGAGLDFGTVSRVRLRSEVEMAALAVYDLISNRTAMISTWSSFSGGNGADVDVRVEVRTTDDDPSGAPVWSDWARLDSSEILTRAVQARAQLTSGDPAYAPVVNELRISAEEVA
ncbi:phage tail protein [Roseicyclus marinus]|uniref:phage tail protein n=1 Tax=Roseicyclus marinus TaxID=2161673 RepID=UPI0024108F42|nr:phage tail protein [Roseicyclus marinus]MDG3040431.1 phage tail protein [Roseicyclus marinus]